ncbi:recombinase family protein [Pseudarthrobacter sp. S9]|uniref:recombinase family protein n=1 Tax=Pseudarthrobacter sp. S9 TaxID=3418421 RepID=UPI003CFF1AB7
MGSIGYARVSTVDQNADLQHAALRVAGCNRILRVLGIAASRETSGGRMLPAGFRVGLTDGAFDE